MVGGLLVPTVLDCARVTLRIERSLDRAVPGRREIAPTEILTGDGLEGTDVPSSESGSPSGVGEARRLRLRGVRKGSGDIGCEPVPSISTCG